MLFLRDAILSQLRMVQRINGGRVQWTQGGQTITIPTAYGRTLYEADDSAQGGTVRIEFNDRDFLIAADDLVIGGQAVQPDDQAHIMILDGPDAGECYELAPIPGKKCYERRDAQGIGLRCHAKRIAIVAN